MSPTELKQLCMSWNGSEEDFHKIVREVLNSCSIPARVIADEFEVAESTVRRWANGVAKPFPRMRNQIINYIRSNLYLKG